MKKQRKHYAPEEKVAILRRHLLEQVPISELCDKHGLQPTVFYRWQKEFFENGTAAFQPKGRPNHSGGGTFRRRVEQRIMAGVKARR
jgi:transposase